MHSKLLLVRFHLATLAFPLGMLLGMATVQAQSAEQSGSVRIKMSVSKPPPIEEIKSSSSNQIHGEVEAFGAVLPPVEMSDFRIGHDGQDSDPSPIVTETIESESKLHEAAPRALLVATGANVVREDQSTGNRPAHGRKPGMLSWEQTRVVLRDFRVGSVQMTLRRREPAKEIQPQAKAEPFPVLDTPRLATTSNSVSSMKESAPLDIQPEDQVDSERPANQNASIEGSVSIELQPRRGDADDLDLPPSDLPIAKSDVPGAENTNCPGAPDGEPKQPESQPDDIPLVQDEHPFNTPEVKVIPKPARLSESVPSPGSSLSSEDLARRQGINQCLNYFLTHQETVTRRGPWALMHTILPYGVEANVDAGGRSVNAIGWLCYNGVAAKQRMFQPTRTGFRTNSGPGVQGHEGQFLAILAQSRVRSDYPLKIGDRSYTIADLVRYEMATCREDTELTFKLIGLSYYLSPEARWRDNRGINWNLEKIVVEEMQQPVIGAACGGTHRLMGLSYALIRRQEAGLPGGGNWKRAEDYVNDFVNYAMSLQNPDGSFSTEWFEGRATERDLERKVQTTGHILEWLVFTLPDEHLKSPRITLSIDFLLQTIGKNPGYDWPIGPRGHALRALALYNQRVYGAEFGQMQKFIANSSATPVRR
ncbi:MAG: hypothetical protein KDB03_13185 [Planctomycetales bacterium]|nr:hypothetical protein [Planctomycetales bacterium]